MLISTRFILALFYFNISQRKIGQVPFLEILLHPRENSVKFTPSEISLWAWWTIVLKLYTCQETVRHQHIRWVFDDQFRDNFLYFSINTYVVGAENKLGCDLGETISLQAQTSPSFSQRRFFYNGSFDHWNGPKRTVANSEKDQNRMKNILNRTNLWELFTLLGISNTFWCIYFICKCCSMCVCVCGCNTCMSSQTTRLTMYTVYQDNQWQYQNIHDLVRICVCSSQFW